MDPASSITQSDGFAHTAYFSGPDAGTSTIRAQDQQTGEGAYCTVKVFKITQNPNQIFWFAGGVSPDDQPAGYPLQATLTAAGSTTGTFKWQIVSGAAYAGFWDGTNWLPNPTTRTDINTITLRAKAAAPLANSVKIKFTYGTVVIHTGWPTDYDYRTKTAWDAVFPNKGDVGINEEWTTALQHSQTYPNYNWDLIGDRVPGCEAGQWSDPPSGVHDRLRIEDEVPPFANPLPIPGNGTLVDWQGQRFRMGSETPGVGVIVKSHTLRGYLGYGRHDPD